MTLFESDDKPGDGGWVEIIEEKGKFFIVRNSMTEEGDPVKNKTRLGFSSWDEDSVRNLDDGASSQSQKLKLSSHLKCEDVEIREKVIISPSLDSLKKALEHVTFSAWSEGDL